MKTIINLLFRSVAEVHSVENVVTNTAREQDGLLLDESDLRLVIPLVVQVLDLGAGEKNFTILRVVEALNKLDDGGLSAA